ncbi:MAG: hypothetical protein FWF52_05065 [Candidatus Azobacteroides sp.]|nr:hypothetical protein [Candidatus Azobacteroides sp.]
MKAKLLLLTSLFFLPVFGESVAVPQETTVTICTGKYSKRYHNSICRGMKACKGEVKKVKRWEAMNMGLTPCGYCYR